MSEELLKQAFAMLEEIDDSAVLKTNHTSDETNLEGRLRDLVVEVGNYLEGNAQEATPELGHVDDDNTVPLNGNFNFKINGPCNLDDPDCPEKQREKCLRNTRQGWLPIGTAPKDGTLIMLGDPSCVKANCRWHATHGWVETCESSTGTYGFAPLVFIPTKWQPNPEPPKD